MIRSVIEIIKEMAGLHCSRKEVGRSKSLSLGLGEESRALTKFNNRPYREWEIGTYRCAWRVVCGGKVLCGSQDVVDSIGDLDAALQQVELGRFVSLRMAGAYDIQIEFDNHTIVEFFATMSDEDEALHIFCPDGRVAEFSVSGGWRMGPADRPWATAEEGIGKP